MEKNSQESVADKIHNTEDSEENKTKLRAKRSRSENWQPEDKHLLTTLVKERVKDIENKNSDTKSNSRKIAAWKDLCASFNTLSKGGVNRNILQLKAQWSVIKMDAKKTKNSTPHKILKTGPPPEIVPFYAEDILSWLPNESNTDDTIFEYDSDQINQNEDNSFSRVLVIDSNDGTIKKPRLEHEYFQSAKIVNSAVIEIIDSNEKAEMVTLGNQPTLRRKLKKQLVKKKEDDDKKQYMANIANTEVECRRELHAIQMENEKKKSRNLDLEQTLILRKIAFYEQKFNNK